MPASETPPEIAKIRDLLNMQSGYFEFYLTEHLGFSAEEIQEVLAEKQSPPPPGPHQ